MVALRKESVDRNLPMCIIKLTPLTSLSARRAWIEIKKDRQSNRVSRVALRKESVDRNSTAGCNMDSSNVALRKESVDRNLNAMQVVIVIMCRSPQGERG